MATTTKTKTQPKATTQKTKSTSKSKQQRKIPWGMIIEILLLGLELANTLLPLPWRLILPLAVGFWTIWVKYKNDTTLRRAALVEGLFMSLNVAANLLPLYWRLAAFFLLGVRSIYIRYKHKHAGKNCYCDNPPKSKK